MLAIVSNNFFYFFALLFLLLLYLLKLEEVVGPVKKGLKLLSIEKLTLISVEKFSEKRECK